MADVMGQQLDRKGAPDDISHDMTQRAKRGCGPEQP